MLRVPIRACLSGMLLASTFAWLPAQEQPGRSQSSSGILFKQSVRRVILDVVVTDSIGRPVRDLTEKDFAVTEDGKPQRVLSFDVHDFDPTLDFTPPKLPPLPANTFVNVPTAPERGPLYVILYDLVNMEQDNQAYARQQLLKFIKSKPEGARFAIFVLSDGLHLVQGFSSDPGRLLEVMDPKSPHPHVPALFLYGRNYGRGDIKYMIQVFNYIAHFLDGQPGRKNVIWMSDNFPIRLFPSDDDGQAYQEEIKETLDLMTREQVAVYPVDTQGVVVDDPHAPAGAASGGGVTADYRSGGSPQPGNATGDGSLGNAGGTAGASRAAGGPGYSLLSSSYMTQDEMARVTGGRAYYSKNDLKDALAEATDNGATYYTFTYSPSNPNYNGKLRSIHVELAKHGYQLSYRHSYYADDPDAPPRPGKRDVARVTTDFHAPKDPLSASMEHGAPISHDLLFKAYLRAKGEPGLGTPEQMAAISQAGFLKEHRPGKPGKPVPPVKLQTYEIDYTLLSRQVWITLGAGGQESRLEVAAAVFDSDGKLLNGTVQKVGHDESLFATASTSNFYRVKQDIDAHLNAAWIRIAVHDMGTGRSGAMEIPLPLPAESQAGSPTAGAPASVSSSRVN